MSKPCPTCNSEFGRVKGRCPTCSFDYANNLAGLLAKKSSTLMSSDQMVFHARCAKAPLPELRSDFLVVHVTESAVFLVDNAGVHRPVMSVTNDAEAVCAHVARHHPGRRIFYRDTQGSWDELAHEGGRFTTFLPGTNGHTPPEFFR